MRTLAGVALVVAFCAVGLCASLALAAAPRAIVVSGEPLARPVVIRDSDAVFVLVQEIAESRTLPRSELRRRPRLRVSLFWVGRPSSELRPRYADQHGFLFPRWRGLRAAIDLPWAGRWPRSLSSKALAILRRHGVPTRLPG